MTELVLHPGDAVRICTLGHTMLLRARGDDALEISVPLEEESRESPDAAALREINARVGGDERFSIARVQTDRK